MQKVMMDFFLEKNIVTLTMLYVNLQLEGIDQYKMTMQKNWEALEAPKFEKDRNCKNYSRWGCYFQFSPMGVNNLPIEGRFLP
jgi:hypothetical protein